MKVDLKVIFASITLAGSALSHAATIFTEAFDYANGPLITRPSTPWTTTSGTANQVDVTSNIVNLTSSESEDVAANFSSSQTTGTISATMDVFFTALPTAGGSYFTHFKDATAGGFRSRVGAQTTGAVTGKFRLNISNDGGATIPVPTDLSLNTTYSITFTWAFATQQSTLSINGGTAVTDTDAATNLTLTSFGLRQAAGIGTLTGDNIIVTVVPEPNTSALLGTVGLISLLRRRR